MSKNKTIVVIGGGIAGITCIETILQDYDPSEPSFNRLFLISESNLVKRVCNINSTGRNLETFDVVEEDIINLGHIVPDQVYFTHITAYVERINHSTKSLIYTAADKQQSTLEYDIICICTGSRPRCLDCVKESSSKDLEERIVVLRDTNTVKTLEKKLSSCRRLIILGNGGISLELVTRISNCEKIWIVREEFIGSVFLDSEAGKFLLDAANVDNNVQPSKYRVGQSYGIKDEDNKIKTTSFGPALGPGWAQNVQLHGDCEKTENLQVIYGEEARNIIYCTQGKYPLKVETTGEKQIECDLIVMAIGVEPNTLKVDGGNLDVSIKDGGILIDDQMRTSLKSTYAAGDIASCENWPSNSLWFQMRLWTQARHMGYYVSKCILAHIQGRDPSIYFNFDCFTHCTIFFGYKVVLLGRYNGQLIDKDKFHKCEIIVRVNPRKDYIKLLLLEGKIVGAVLIGNSGMEETIENLIHDAIDVSAFKETLLDGTLDIDDYFD